MATLKQCDRCKKIAHDLPVFEVNLTLPVSRARRVFELCANCRYVIENALTSPTYCPNKGSGCV